VYFLKFSSGIFPAKSAHKKSAYFLLSGCRGKSLTGIFHGAFGPYGRTPVNVRPGVAVGLGLGLGLTVGLGETVGEGLGFGVTVGETVGDGLTVGLGFGVADGEGDGETVGFGVAEGDGEGPGLLLPKFVLSATGAADCRPELHPTKLKMINPNRMARMLVLPMDVSSHSIFGSIRREQYQKQETVSK